MNTYVWIKSLSELREGDRVVYADDVTRRIQVERVSAWDESAPLRFIEDERGNVVALNASPETTRVVCQNTLDTSGY